MLLRAARIVKIESPEDPRLEELLKRIFVKDINEPSANFMFETLLAAAQRWEDLERHQMRRVDRAGDHAAKADALRMFALEWLQRFKDTDRGAKFFDAALKTTASNGMSTMTLGRRRVLARAPGAGRQGRVVAAARSRGRRARARRRGRADVRRAAVRTDRVRQGQRSRAREEVLRDRRADRAAEPQRSGLHLGRRRSAGRRRADGVGLDAGDPAAGRSSLSRGVPSVEEKQSKKGKRSKRNSAQNIPVPRKSRGRSIPSRWPSMRRCRRPCVVEAPPPAPAPAPVAVEAPHVETKPMPAARGAGRARRGAGSRCRCPRGSRCGHAEGQERRRWARQGRRRVEASHRR